MRRSVERLERQRVSRLHWNTVPMHFAPRRDAAFAAASSRRILDDSGASASKRLKAAINLAWIERTRGERAVEISCLTIGSVRVIHLPGEPFVQYQLAAQKLRPGIFVAVAGYGDCGMGYIGGDRIFTDRGGYEQTFSFAGPSEKIFLVAIRKLLETSGTRPAPLEINAARVAVTGHDVNRPDPYPGRGEFSWPGNIQRLPDGDLVLAHSAGYYHVSFAEPRLIEKSRRKSWLAQGWPLDFPAPTGGRSMLVRSSDGGKTWSKPTTIVDLPLDDAPYGLLRCPDGTLLCFINVQASWYGFTKAPSGFEDDLGGLNTRQCVVRSTDGGESWSAPIWLESPGDFYERSHAQPILLPGGAILWPTYFMGSGDGKLGGAIHRSDDSGQTWRTIATISRKGSAADTASAGAGNVDEPAIVRLADGRLFLVCRPDGGRFISEDDGVTWKASGRLVTSGKLKAPRLFVLGDGTIVCVCTYGNLRVFLGRADETTWTGPIPLDPSSYGYPGGMMLEDESILVSYCSSGRAPNRIYSVRFRVTDDRRGIELLPIDG